MTERRTWYFIHTYSSNKHYTFVSLMKRYSDFWAAWAKYCTLKEEYRGHKGKKKLILSKVDLDNGRRVILQVTTNAHE
jgi:hypothetical protein